jgi:gamma-glutamyl-gamma-aminobutyrate hydrolase PuuD
MKILAISQRVENITQYSEKRDCLDQRWTSFAHSLGFIATPLSNLSNPVDVINTIKPSAIILSGGNSIASLDLTAPDISLERDEFEKELLVYAIEKNIPVLGICRGMQMINMFFNGQVSKVSEHVSCRHQIDFIDKQITLNSREVNSYHGWGIPSSKLAKSLRSFALAKDKTVEGFYHTKLRIAGIMWHPERESPFNKDDLSLIKNFLL